MTLTVEQSLAQDICDFLAAQAEVIAAGATLGREYGAAWMPLEDLGELRIDVTQQEDETTQDRDLTREDVTVQVVIRKRLDAALLWPHGKAMDVEIVDEVDALRVLIRDRLKAPQLAFRLDNGGGLWSVKPGSAIKSFYVPQKLREEQIYVGVIYSTWHKVA